MFFYSTLFDHRKNKIWIFEYFESSIIQKFYFDSIGKFMEVAYADQRLIFFFQIIRLNFYGEIF
ncbi:hypothetical protein KFK09_026245 [Dendrobium nobile]|uniref:Uncharacterized protein n=1 Tax=Dendrobium nobile TaxID=94219 RepID=A0A8T3A872_DENNO|nr:hypothetical protein KFK09_026245 [Dendrobium nobile]